MGFNATVLGLALTAVLGLAGGVLFGTATHGTVAQTQAHECSTGECHKTVSTAAPGTLASAELAPAAPRSTVGTQSLFDTSDFPPRWKCGTWSDTLGWTHIVSDILIFLAYSAIPFTLAFFIRTRTDLPFPFIFWLFSAFIFACGVGHLIEAVIFWWPVYRVAAVSKVITAAVSWATIAALLPIIPKALALPGLMKINDDLRKEITERQRTEQVLQQRSAELTEANESLERFNRVTMGRENRIIELKNEINALAERFGTPPPYKGVYQGERT